MDLWSMGRNSHRLGNFHDFYCSLSFSEKREMGMELSNLNAFGLVFYRYRIFYIFQGDYMRRHKSSVSGAISYKEIGEFWDTHDLSDFWDKTKEASFEVDIESEITYYAVDKMLSEKIQAIAQKRGVTADTLINLWVQEKLQEQKTL